MIRAEVPVASRNVPVGLRVPDNEGLHLSPRFAGRR
jgi:hypothetical protein